MGRLGFVVCIALAGLAAAGAVALAVTRTGTSGGERIVGTKGADLLDGRGGKDNLIGREGRDVLIGGGGEDRLEGDGGRDGFNMRAGEALAAPGRDRIYARDGHPDEIDCGAGRDLAVVDAVEDGIYDCEVVSQP